MEKYEEIVANIEKELVELTKINKQLKEENASLRERLGMPTQRNNAELCIGEAFDYFDVEGDSGNVKLRAYNTLGRSGYCEKSVKVLEGKSVYELFAIRNMGCNSLAVIIIMLEHFGVKIEIPNSDCEHDMPYYHRLRNSGKSQYATIINQLTKKIKEYKEKIIFKD